MKPKVIMHTQISLDGGINGFENSEIYYHVSNRFNANMILFGSNTVFTAAEQYPSEEESDFTKPTIDRNDKRLLWVIPDSRGRLRNLHVFRNTEWCKDIIILVSQATPQSYLDYLKERNYDFIIAGKDHVDYHKSLDCLYNQYDCKIIRTDSGGILNNVLLEQGLVDEISLIVSPVLVGTVIPKLFRSLSLQEKVHLKLIHNEVVKSDYLFLIYKVLR